MSQIGKKAPKKAKAAPKKQASQNEQHRKKWSALNQGILVETWQQYECLYDISAENFHDKGERQLAMEALSKATGMTSK